MKKNFVYPLFIISILVVGSCVVYASSKFDNQKQFDNIYENRYIPSTALSMKDEKFDTLYKNSGTYFESIDTIQTLSVNSEDTNYERKISDEEAIEIAKEHIGYEEYYKSEVSNISTEFLLYSNSGLNTERRPVIAVTFDGLLFSTAKNKPTVSQTKILVDSLTGDVVRLISVGHN